MSTLNVFEQTRDAVFRWAARAQPAALRAGIDLYFGEDRRTEEALPNALCFALQLPDADGMALFERYAAANPSLPRAQRTAIAAWRGARFGLYEVRAVELDQGFHLLDVITERTSFVQERAATHQVPAGAWLFAVVVPMGDHLELEGTLGLIPEAARVYAVQAALAAYGGRTDVDAATSRRGLGPAFAAIERSRRPPRFLNTDGHDLELLTATLDQPWDAIADVVEGWPGVYASETADGEEQLDVTGETPNSADALGGPAVRATFTDHADGARLFVNSRARYDEMLARLRAALPVEVVALSTSATPSNPKGPAMYVDAAALSAEESEDVAREGADPAALVRARMTRGWADGPIPALGGQTPREALAAGRRAEVRALAPDRETAVELGL